ncbi:hypothetical protein ACA758_02715 [Mycoplasmopsis agassizii]|uniref:hypothetical protein n=1 Tax=Mycoplasmopsis agassizii TaxID=33922 RepID=UPI003527B6B1
MKFDFNQSTKVAIEKWLFFTILGVILAIISLYVINVLVSLYDQQALTDFASSQNIISEDEAWVKFRQILIIKIVINSVVYIFYAILNYFAWKSIKVGYIYVLFWSFVNIASILSVWLTPSSPIWLSVLITIFNVVLLALLFYIFVLLKQNRFYVNNQRRWT